MAKKETGKAKAAPRRKKAPLNVQGKVSSAKETTETSKVKTGAKGTIRPAAKSQIAKPEKKLISFIVHGKVSSSNSNPQPGLTVKAFDRDISWENLLGSTITDQAGAYRITFIEAQFKRSDSERGGPEVYIRVFDSAGHLLGQSKTVNDAPRELNLDLPLPALTPETMHKQHITDLITSAVGDKSEVAKAILGYSEIKTTRDIAKLNINNLAKLIAPDAKPGSKKHQQAKSQATAINNQSFVREPLTVLHRMTQEGELPIADVNVRAGLGTFLQRIPADTDIRLTPLHKVLTEEALKDVPEEQQAAVVDNAKALWRTLAITPPGAPQALTALMKTNRTSAFQVGEMPESTFLQAYSGPMGKETAQQVYTNAINTRIRNEHALITMREAIRGTGLAVIDGTKTREERLTEAKQYADTNDIQLNLDRLFEDMDYCECKECQSVYSASSYYVELLNFLRNNNLGSDPSAGEHNKNIHKGIAGTPLEKLFRRRPDLGDLELSCENTNTVLPYIDLVNEVMESFVVNRAEFAASNGSQTKLEAFNIVDETKDELLAQPQHTDYKAYCILKNEAVHPFTLPFHQPIEAARIFLKYLGTSRYEVLDTFRAAHEAVVNLRDPASPLADTCDCGDQREIISLAEEKIRAVQEAARKEAAERAARIAKQAGERERVTAEDQAKQPHVPERGTGRLTELHKIVLDRSADAEFLGLTQDEYIILTKEAFWPKEYFDYTQRTTFSEKQYQDNIRVRPVNEYYGYPTEDQMLNPAGENLSFVKTNFLPRTGIQYTDLVELLKTHYINPCYPQGLALEILEAIRFSYQYLKSLVNTDSNDPAIRFADLIKFLATNQSWTSVPRVVEAWRKNNKPAIVKGNNDQEANPIIQRWVYSCFEKLGKLIVLESGESPRLPFEGNLFVEGAENPCAALRIDGTIINPSNSFLCGTVSVTVANESDGRFGAYAGPVHWTIPQWGDDTYLIKAESGKSLGGIDASGVWTRDRNKRKVLVMWMAPKDTCNLDKVRLQHLDGSPVTVPEYDRMQRFIRLWRKLGWTINEVDKALVSFAPRTNRISVAIKDTRPHFPGFEVVRDSCNRTAEEAPGFGSNLCGNVATSDITPDFLQQLVAVKKLLERTGLPLVKLLAFWSDISTAGEKSLYSQLFLNRNMVGIDDVFKADDNGYYLSGAEQINAHLPVLMAALRLKAPEIAAVLAITDMEDAPLTLQHVSTLYRCGLLAKALHVKTSDLNDLEKLFGNPFADAVTTLKLFEAWKIMEDAGFTFRQLTYIINNCDDPAKPLAPSEKTILQTAKTLYDGLTAIERGNPDLAAVKGDNPNVTEEDLATTELVRTKVGQIFDPQFVEKIVGLLEGTTIYTTNAPDNLTILGDTARTATAGKLKYINTGSIQVIGILTDAEKVAVKTLLDGNTEWADAIERVGKQVLTFFTDALAPVFSDSTRTESENITAIDEARAALLAGDVIPAPGDQVPADKPQPTAPQKRCFFLERFLPLLRQRLQQRLITATMATTFGIAPDVASILLLEVLVATGSPQSTAMSILATMPSMQNETGKPWTGYLIPPADDDYVFVVTVEKDPNIAPKALAIDELKDPELKFVDQQVDPTNVWSTKPVRLKAGVLYSLTIADGDPGGLKWRRTGSPAGPIPATALLPKTTKPVEDIFIGFGKAAIVVNGLNLAADEVRYFQNHGADFGHLDFKTMTLKSWQRLAAYVVLRDSLPKTELRLLDLFAWSRKPDDASKLVDKLNMCTQWEKERIRSLLLASHFDLNRPGAFCNEASLVRMQKAIAVADKVGVDIDRLFYWAVPGTKFWPCHYIAEDIRMAMRARFDAEDFEQAVKPLSDQLRERQKQALTAFLLTQPDLKAWPVVDADSLFEFFLIDVQMGAERETSRMVQAIASVQLFIKRCLMGLEDKRDASGNPIGVLSGDIDHVRWEWMQKYRVWEANRKVFLYPENWIRPELRDDKSPFYKELESELLQKDINPKTVEEALKNYLYKVDEVANLKVVGLFLDDQNQKLHIFARTHNAPYFFFYRYFDTSPNGQYWYPWEKMQVDIPSYDVEEKDVQGNATGKIIQNGTYLIPVVWNNRLLVFFPQFMKKTTAASSDKTLSNLANSTSDNLKPTEMWEIKMAWSEYRKGKWTQKQVSTDAIYNKITFGDLISSYLFIPTITADESKIVIDVYHEKDTTVKPPEPPPAPIYLIGAQLETIQGIAKGIDVDVISLIDGSKLAAKYYNRNDTHTFNPIKDQFVLEVNPDFTIGGPAITLDQCKSFRVDIRPSNSLGTSGLLNFQAQLTLSFSYMPSSNPDPSIPELKVPPKGFKLILLQWTDYKMRDKLTAHFAHLEPNGPILEKITLTIDDLFANGSKKLGSTFTVDLKDMNGKKFAKIKEDYDTGLVTFDNGKKGEDIPFQITPGNENITKMECQFFEVTISANHNIGSVGLDHQDWMFNAKVTLKFKGDDSPLVAVQYQISLHDIASVTFSSTDVFIPTPKEEPGVPDDRNKPSDESETKRFEFSGSQLFIGDSTGDPVQKRSLTNYSFHYENSAEEIHSFQAEDNQTPSLMVGAPYFDSTDTKIAITAQQSFVFHNSIVHEVLGKLNSDKLDDLFKYYVALYPNGMGDAFGSYIDDKNQKSYHELKQPYSLYNWEVCFHAPMQLVEHLLKSQQFDQAIAMFHYVFNPLAKPGDNEEITKSCWQFPPFKEIDAKNVLENLFNDLQPGIPDCKINEWREKPFQPHVVARNRPSAYMKYVVMKYIEILIAYGDYYFRQNTMESIPLAIQCYVMASHLYGPRGQKIPPRGKIESQTYNSLLDKWDAFGNAMVELELAFPFSNQIAFPIAILSGDVALPNVFGFASTLFFGIPDNPNLTALRDTIDDRLFKIRHCEDIEGVFRQLPLFEPPIDPALLVQAAAQGLSLSSVLNDMNSPMPNYRFYYLLQKALELCGELKALGNAFLSAKEKGDAEALSNMRAKHESGIHNLVMEVKKQQLEEATKSLEALQQTRKGPASRMQYYLQLIGEELSKVPDDSTDFSDLPNQLEQPLDESGLKLIRYEKEEMDKASNAKDEQKNIGQIEILASILSAMPNVSMKMEPWGVGTGISFGGSNLGSAAQAIARSMQIDASDLSYQSTSASRKGGFLRQLQDRVQQANAAGYEIKNIDKQILTQQIRIAIANQEIANQQQQIDNAQEVEEFLKNKYTNEELYSWMEGEIRTLYRQAYDLTYDLAKKVEKAYRFERGLTESNFIQYGYWDAGRDGLLAGERLHLALKHLEAAYQEKRGYDYEVTKHVSLRQIDPLAFLRLRESGKCEFALPEVLFDMDHPGHYMRRIKSVALTVPCVVGPYTSINCTLRLLEHKFRTKAISSPRYAETTDETDERFSTVNVPITSIAVSNGQNDSGVFELNFRDERYIPFEGAGVISKWRIELPTDFRQFDYDTISDVIMHIRYTAVDGGYKLKVDATDSVKQFIKGAVELSQEEGLFAIFDLKSDFPTQWNKANHPPADAKERVMALGNLYERLPLFTKPWQLSPTNIKKIQPTDVWLFTLFTSANGLKFAVNGASFGAGVPEGDMVKLHLSDTDVPSDLENWTLTIKDVATDIKKLWLVVRYTLGEIGS